MSTTTSSSSARKSRYGKWKKKRKSKVPRKSSIQLVSIHPSELYPSKKEEDLSPIFKFSYSSPSRKREKKEDSDEEISTIVDKKQKKIVPSPISEDDEKDEPLICSSTPGSSFDDHDISDETSTMIGGRVYARLPVPCSSREFLLVQYNCRGHGLAGDQVLHTDGAQYRFMFDMAASFDESARRILLRQVRRTCQRDDTANSHFFGWFMTIVVMIKRKSESEPSVSFSDRLYRLEHCPEDEWPLNFVKQEEEDEAESLIPIYSFRRRLANLASRVNRSWFWLDPYITRLPVQASHFVTINIG